MFDFSWAELAVVGVIGLLVIGPDELPGVIRNCKNILSKIKEIGTEFTSAITDIDEVDELKKEAKKVNDDLKKIIDLDGNLQDTYELSDIMPEIEKAKKGKENA